MSAKKQCKLDKLELNNLIHINKTGLEKLKEKFKKLDQIVADHSDELLRKANLDEFNKTKDLVLKLPKHEDVERQKQYVNKTIELFEHEINLFKKGFEQQKEMIRRFDEILS